MSEIFFKAVYKFIISFDKDRSFTNYVILSLGDVDNFIASYRSASTFKISRSLIFYFISKIKFSKNS
jgi:hypothetical protein